MSGHGCVTLASTWVGVVVVFMLLDVSFFQKHNSPRNSKSKEEKKLCISGLHKAVLLSHMRRLSFGGQEGEDVNLKKKKKRERENRAV